MIMKRFKELIEFVGLSYKKEMIKLIIINVAIVVMTVVAYIFMKQTLFLMLGLAVLVIGNYLLINTFSNKKRR